MLRSIFWLRLASKFSDAAAFGGLACELTSDKLRCDALYCMQTVSCKKYTQQID